MQRLCNIDLDLLMGGLANAVATYSLCIQRLHKPVYVKTYELVTEELHAVTESCARVEL